MVSADRDGRTWFVTFRRIYTDSRGHATPRVGRVAGDDHVGVKIPDDGSRIDVMAAP